MVVVVVVRVIMAAPFGEHGISRQVPLLAYYRTGT